MAAGKVLEDFAGQTTAHGLNRIAGGSRLWIRVFWALMVLLALCLCGWQISLLFIKYYNYPVQEEIKVRETINQCT